MKLIFWIIAAVAAIPVARLLVEVLDVAVNLVRFVLGDLFGAARNRLQEVSAGANESKYKNQRRQAYQEYLRGSRSSGGVDPQVVDAVKHGPQLRRLVFLKLPAA